MKSWLSCSLALILFTGSLLPQGDLCELAKVPALVKHYVVHDEAEHAQRSGRHLSFLDFLSMHYSETRANAGGDDHKNLPFLDHCPVASVFTLTEPVIPALQLPATETTRAAYSIPHYSFHHSISIFQPPRPLV